MDAAGSNSLHIVVFPWLAFGHMIPYLELSKSLASKGHRISFLATPRNIQRLPRIPSPFSSLITFIEIRLPSVPGLPEHAESTTDLPPDKVPYLKKAFDALQNPFVQFLRAAESSSAPPDWVIHDFAHHWLCRVASDAGVPTVFFSIYNAAVLAFLGPPAEMIPGRQSSRASPEDFTVPPPWVPFPSKVALRLHEARKVVSDNFRDGSSGVTDSFRMGTCIEGCDVVAVRSGTEIEEKWLRLLREIFRKPVIPVGLLPPVLQVEEAAAGGGDDDKNNFIFEWLDKRAPGSVVYVAFGSEAALSIEHLHEVALGLELSDQPFLWALRQPTALPPGAKLLPDLFEERTSGRGLVFVGWVPQLRVLAHRSVGSFLTHAGWSSIIEAAQFGHPLALLPIFADQHINSRVAEEAGLGVEVRRGEEDGSLKREDVAAAVKRVAAAAGEGERESLRTRAKEVSALFVERGGSHGGYVEVFAEFLVEHRGRRRVPPLPQPY